MKNIKVLDVTLRDGGCVNNFNFGSTYMKKILDAQEASGIDIIELGYIDEKNGSACGRTQYSSEQIIPGQLLSPKKSGTTYVAMIDYGKFDIDRLSHRDPNGIDGIRLAFHKKDIRNMIPLGRRIMEKGYIFFVQPMITFRYSDSELLELIECVNNELSEASAFYIVDSFGEMRPSDLNRILSLVDHNLTESMPIGLHSHNNLQMSYSNACALLDFPTKRDIILDSSIMGMGKGAGNLNTELLVEHLNRFYGKNYSIEPLLSVIDEVINQLHDEFYWGYSVEYYLSSINHCTPSYASHFFEKHMLPIDQVSKLLSMIKEEKKISFDKDYAESLYREFNEKNPVDDHNVVQRLTRDFKSKTVLLVAPGRSILAAKKQINELTKRRDVVSIGLNSTLDMDFDYILTTREDLFRKESAGRHNIIVPSSVCRSGNSHTLVLNYHSWIDVDERTHDSSSVIALNLLKACGAKEILLAGFDGFSVNINENYYDPNLRHPVSAEQQERRNRYYKNFISRIQNEGISVRFITPSKYQEHSSL